MSKSIHEFRVLTWNIHGCVGIDGRHDIKRIGKVISSLYPDIVALQEVDLRQNSQTSLDSFKKLCDLIGKYTQEAWSIADLNGNYGQVLISRYPLINKNVHDISLPNREPRKVMDTLVEFPAGPVRVIATHLGLLPNEKKYQIYQLEKVLQLETSLPLMFMGDVNEWLGNSVKCILNKVFEYQSTHASYPSPVPILALDRIACTGEFKIIESRVVHDAWWASDHLPVFAVFQTGKNLN
ncbi:MAG: endonuclease/exonuclease/phosphatase family protein [Gammaproteobacteria bacterium]|jgi:endonuclease/exonuclease/phosphatase family metal-dependent hydrolase